MEFKKYPTAEQSEFADEFVDEDDSVASEFTDESTDEFSDLDEGENPKRTIGGTLADIPISIVKGTFGVVEGITGAVGFVAPWVRKWLHKEGYDPKAAHASVDKTFSPAQRAATKKVEEAEGFKGTVKAHLKNPSTIVHGVIQQVPNFVTMAALGGTLVAAGVKKLVAAPVAEGLITTGQMSEEIIQERGDGTLGMGGRAAALAGGAGTALISGVGGRVAHKFGFADLDTWMVGQKIDPKKAVSRVASVVYGSLGEGFQELGQEAQEAVFVNAALGRPLMENVAKQAATGAVIGAAAGGAINVHTGVGLNDPRRFDQPKKAVAQKVDPSSQSGADLDAIFGETSTEAGFMSGITTDRNLDITKREEMQNVIERADSESKQQQAREQERAQVEAETQNKEREIQVEQNKAYTEKLVENTQFEDFVERVQDPNKFLDVVGKVVHEIDTEKPTEFSKLAKKAHKVISVGGEVNIKGNQDLAYELSEQAKHAPDQYEKYISGTLARILLNQSKQAEVQAEFVDEPVSGPHEPISGPVKKATTLEEMIGKPDGEVTPISGKSTQDVSFEKLIGKRPGEKMNRPVKAQPGDFDVSKLRTAEPTVEDGPAPVGVETGNKGLTPPFDEGGVSTTTEVKPELAPPIKEGVKVSEPKPEKSPGTFGRVGKLSKGDIRSDTIREVSEDIIRDNPGRRIVPIHQVFDDSGLDQREFREGLKLLRNDQVIQLHGGDPSIMTKEQIDNSFKDERGDIFIGMSWLPTKDGEVSAKARRKDTRDKVVYHGRERAWKPEPKFPHGKPDLARVRPGNPFGHGWYSTEVEETAKAYGEQVYKIDIPDYFLPRFLKWEQTIGEQSPEVREAIKKTNLLKGKGNPDKWTGQEVYKYLVSKNEHLPEGDREIAASKAMAKMGIVGNFHQDKPGSKGAPKEKFNYVIWDQNVLDRIVLLKRNEESLEAPKVMAPKRNPEVELRKAQTRFKSAETDLKSASVFRRPFMKSLPSIAEEIADSTGWLRSKDGTWTDITGGELKRGETRESFVGKKGAPTEAKNTLEDFTSGTHFTDGEFAEGINKTQVEMTNDPKVGGSTFTPFGENLAGTDNIAVSIFPELSKVIKGPVTEKQLARFKENNAPLIIKNPMLSFGTWYDKGSDQTYLDVVLRVPRDFKDLAIDLGKEYNQKAVFDLKTFEEIDTGGTGENALTREQRLDRDTKLSELLLTDETVREKIWKDTGWWEFMPGQWSFELDDSKAKMQDGAAEAVEDAGNWGVPLEKVLDHPKLFASHPSLKNVTVISDKHAGAAFWRFDKSVGGPSIRMDADILRNGYKTRSPMQIIMHELQHGIQWQEGFAAGGSPRSFSLLEAKMTVDGIEKIPTPLYLALVDKVQSTEVSKGDSQLWGKYDKKPISFSNKEVETMRDSWDGTIKEGFIKDPVKLAEYQDSLDLLKHRYIVTMTELPYVQYKKLGGEIQSRLVEKRIKMSAEERSTIPPWVSLTEMLHDEGIMKEGDRLSDIIDSSRKSGIITRAEGVPKIGKIHAEKDIGIMNMIDKLQTLAKKADRVILVEKQSMLPEELGKADVKEAIEATWDQKEGKVYFVLENIKDADHAVKIWMHEQVGHKGMMELFADQGVEFDEFLDFAYDTIKKSPALFNEVSKLYHDPELSPIEEKRLIVEEVIARRAERLNPFARKNVFQRLLDFMNRWVRRVTGFKQEDIKLTMKDIDNILESAKNRLIYGEVRGWLEFKHTDKEYKDWAKEVLRENARALNWYTTGTEGITSVLNKDSDLYKFLLGITSAATDVKSNSAYAAQTYAHLAGKRKNPAGRYPSIVQKKIDRLKAGNKTFGKGYKVDEFVRGLLGDPNSTTNDRWMHFLLFGPHMLTAKDVGLIQSGKSGYAGEADLMSLFSTWENTASRHKLFDLARQLTKETGHEWEPRQVQAALWMKVVSEANNIPLKDMKYDYAEVFFKFQSPILGREIGRDTATPWEYIQHIVGDDIGRVKEIAGMGDISYDPQSQLDEKYRAHLEKQGVKEVPGFTKEDIEKVRDKRSKKHEHLALRETPVGMKAHIDAMMESSKEWFGEKMKFFTEGGWQEALFDDLHRVKEYSGTAWKSFRLYRGLPSMIGSLMKDGPLMWNSETNHVKLGEVDGGLLGVFKGLSQDVIIDMKARLIAERVESLTKSGAVDQKILDRIYGDDSSGVPIDTVAYTSKLLSDTGYLAGDKRYQQVKKHLRRYNQEMLNIAEKSGVISEEAREKFEQYDYIPLNRIFPDDADIDGSPLFSDTKVRTGNLKKLKGSAGYTIGDPLDNLARNYTYLLSQSLKNVAFKKLYTDGKDSGMLVHQKMSPAMFARAKQSHDYITMKVSGKEQYVRVDDARLFHALAEMDDSAFTIKVLNMAKKALTAGVTVAPAFRIRNLLRDTGHTWILMGKVSPISVTKAFVDVLREHVDMKKLRAMGGASLGGFYAADNPKHMRDLIDSSQKINSQLEKFTGIWSRIGEASENANRLALFRALQAEGKSELEAGFEARDLLDFSAHGKNKVMRFLTSTVPFLNARLQGLHKIGRQLAHGDRLKIALRGSAVAAASILLHCLNKTWQDDDDPWYDKLSDRERWLFWHFGKNLAIPKPFEIGAIFGELPTRLWDVGVETITGNDKEALKELYKFGFYTTTETFSINPLGQGMIIYEQLANKDFFRGTNIVPAYLERVAPQLQWDGKTSKTARAIGEQFHVSPKRVDHVIDKLFSYAGQAALAASDYVLQPWLKYPVDPAYTLDDYYWLHGRIPRGKQRYIKQEQEFYDLFAEVDRTMATFNRLKKIDLPEARKWREQHGDALRIHSRLSKIKQKLTDLRNREREIYNDDKMDGEEKRRRLDELLDKRHDVILRHLKRAKEYLEDDE